MAKRSLAEANDSLLSAIDSFSETAYNSDSDGDLSADRALAIERYLGRNIDPAPAGRSQVRDRTTFEVVEWTKPSLLRIFTSGSEVCRFDPVGPEDEKQAEQETDYINYVITQRNNWHQICTDWISDGLLLKNGYAYAFWDDAVSVESEFYENLTDDAFALIAADPEITVAGHDQRPNEEADKRNQAAYQQAMMQYQQAAQQAQMQAYQTGQQPQIPPPPQPPQPAFLHDVEIKRTNKRGSAKICVLAPERCRIDINTPSHTLENCNYFEFWDWKTIGQLRSEGLNVADDVGDVSEDEDRDTTVELARDLYSETSSDDATFADPTMRRVLVRYIWIKHDYDGDGINELQYCIVIGKEVVYRKECEEIPVSSWSPIPLAHRHIGMSQADSVADIEDINTNITRQAIDNLNLSNTPRIAVSDRVNMADLLDVRVGGVIRVDGQPPQEFLPVEVPNVFPNAVQALTFFDSRRQNRTGINAYFQGTDANAINKTASGISQLTNSAAQRVEMIARFLATAVERLFLIVHRLTLQHGHAEEVIKLRNRWVTVDPAMWRKRTDVKIAVGLGTGNKDSQIAQLMQMFQVQMAAMPVGNGMVQPQNIYSTLLELAKACSFSTPERFATDPTTLPPQQPQPPLPLVIEQMKTQADMQQGQQDNQLKAQQAQLNAQTQKELEQMRLQFEQWKVQYQAEADFQIEQLKLGLERDKLSVSVDTENRKLQSAEGMKLAEFQRADNEKAMESSEKDSEKNDMAEIKQLLSRKKTGVERIRDKTGRMVGARVAYDDGTVENVTIH